MPPAAKRTKNIREVVDVEYDDEADGYVAPEHAVIFRTVDLFGSLMGRRLLLRNTDKTPSTDGTTIYAPLDNPNAYQIVERQLAHILFRSDPEARGLFLEKYVGFIQQTAKGVSLDKHVIHRAVASVVNILDAHRVLSLWGDMYPGSAAYIRSLACRTVSKEISDAHKGVVPYLACLAVGAEAPPGKMDRFRDTLRLALNRVEGRSYAVTLATARWVVVKLVDELCAAKQPLLHVVGGLEDGVAVGGGKTISPRPEDRAEALKELLEMMGELPPAAERSFDSVEKQAVRERGAEEDSEDIANQALTTNPTDDMFLQSGANQMKAVVNETMEKMAGPLDREGLMMKDTPARVVFHEPEFPERDVLPPLPVQDEVTVRRLRAFFLRVMGRRRNVLDDSGVEVDPVAMLERRITHQNLPVFRRQEKGQGFHAMILLDLSASMDGRDEKGGPTRLEKANAACRIVARALNFPFVKTTVWGYTSAAHGQVDIAKFDVASELYDLPSRLVDTNRQTPTHIAVKLANMHLEEGTETKHLFVITDGRPTLAHRGGANLNWKKLVVKTGDEISQTRRKGVSVTGIMIGDEVNDQVLATMFGPQRFWKKLDLKRFSEDLVTLVSGSFATYLGRR